LLVAFEVLRDGVFHLRAKSMKKANNGIPILGLWVVPKKNKVWIETSATKAAIANERFEELEGDPEPLAGHYLARHGRQPTGHWRLRLSPSGRGAANWRNAFRLRENSADIVCDMINLGVKICLMAAGLRVPTLVVVRYLQEDLHIGTPLAGLQPHGLCH
jgi:hypothetical protein